MAIGVQCMNTVEMMQALESAHFEQLYQKALSQAERIYEEERARSLRVQLFLLEDENDGLREQMDNDGEQLHELEITNGELQDHLADIETQYQAMQMELKTQLRDLDRYKVEVDALNAARADTTTLLSEKLALSRELATLKPEVEHLRTQTATHQSLLGQKLALEREVNSIQVELETEKRAVQRLKAKDKGTSSADAALNEEIEDLKKELAKERRVAKEASFKDAVRVERIEELEQELTRAKRNVQKSTSTDAELTEEIEALKSQLEKEKRKNAKSSSNDVNLAAVVDELRKEIAKATREAQKAERQNLKKATEWDSQKEALEEKLDAFRTKVRTMKEQLKEAQDEVERLQQAKFAATTEATKARLNGANPRKRNVARFDPDMTIGTPGHGGLAKKQRISVNPSDKSNFSITPFLNKTMSILPESPEDQMAEEKANQVLKGQIDTAAIDVEIEGVSLPDVNKKAKTTKKAPAPKAKASKPLQESTNPKANAVVKKPSLPKVTEEEPEDLDSQAENPEKDSEVHVAKKKVLNKRPTIFDDEEDAAPKKTKRLNLGGLKAAGGGMGLGKINLGSKNKVLAEFSPLKKDRRAAVAL